MDDLTEERPVTGALVRHRGARVTSYEVERSAPRIEVHGGALWIRATASGPGVTARHGATTIQVREGAAVLEVSDFEALLVVVSGRAAVKGTAALPRSVTAGNAVTLTLDGGFGTPEALSPEELARDRFVAENLVRDVLAEGFPAAPPPSDAPVAPGALTAPAGARVDGSPPVLAEPGPEPGPEPEPGLEGGLHPGPSEPQLPMPAPVPPVEAEEDEDGGDGEPTPLAYDPEPIAVPSGNDGDGGDGGDDAPPPSRRGLVAVVIVLVILAAVIGAVVLTGDEAGSSPSHPAPGPSAVVAAPPEATLQTCEAEADGYRARGVVSGGGEGVTRYHVVVGLEDVDGQVYVEKGSTVAARTDPATEVLWTVELDLAADEVRPDSECRIVEVDASSQP